VHYTIYYSITVYDHTATLLLRIYVSVSHTQGIEEEDEGGGVEEEEKE